MKADGFEQCDGSDRSEGAPRFRRLRASGGYRNMASFQTATLIYDATYFFCEKFLHPRSRTAEQMVQAARSGRQNIAEGSRASAVSSQTELRLVNVARSSLEELLLDYEDFLRQHRLPQWDPDSPEALAVRDVPKRFKQDRSDSSGPSDLTELTDQERWTLYAHWLEHDDPAVRANAIICLIHQANYLLDHQLSSLERQFIEQGGYSEQLAAERIAERQRRKTRRDRSDRSDPSDPTDRIPNCPRCGQTMVLRTAKTGKNAGRQFWGCSAYPECKGTVEI